MEGARACVCVCVCVCVCARVRHREREGGGRGGKRREVMRAAGDGLGGGGEGMGCVGGRAAEGKATVAAGVGRRLGACPLTSPPSIPLPAPARESSKYSSEAWLVRVFIVVKSFSPLINMTANNPQAVKPKRALGTLGAMPAASG